MKLSILSLLASCVLVSAQTNTSAPTNDDSGFVKAADEFYGKTELIHQTADADKLFSAAGEMTTRWPQDARGWNFLGIAYGLKGQMEKSRAAYKHSIKLDPGYYAPWVNLGSSYSIAGDHEQAIADFKESLRLKPTYINTWLKLGIDQEAVKDITGAIATYREVTKLEPTNEFAWGKLGLILVNQKRFDETISTMNQALQIMPKNEEFYAVLIEAYMKSGKFVEMTSATMELAKINPSNELAQSLYKLKEDQPIPSTSPALTSEALAKGLNARSETITFTNKSGVVISNAEVVKVKPNELIYAFPAVVGGPVGGGTVKLADLPPELQKKFGCDAVAAAKLDEAEREKRVADIKKSAAINAALEKYNRLKNQLEQGRKLIDGKVLQRIDAGLLVDSGEKGKFLEERISSEPGVGPALWHEGNAPGSEAQGLVLLQDYPDPNMADDGHVDIIAYPLGLFSYDTVGKSQKTVRKFSCNLDTAIRKLALQEQ